MRTPQAIETALCNALPDFQSDEPITPEAILRIVTVWTDMAMNWALSKTELMFSNQDGETPEIDWLDGELDCGSFLGHLISEAADREVQINGSDPLCEVLT